MGRPPTPVGTYGRIGFTRLANGSVRARALYRDFDGITRPVTRYGRSKAAAERELKQALRDRTATAGQDITPDTRISDVAKLWRAEIETAEHLAEGSKDTYFRTLDGIVLPGLGGLLVREATVSRVDRFLKAVRKTRGAGAAKSTKTVTSLLLGLAVRHDALAGNPIRETEKVRRNSRKARPKALTIDETTDLLKKVAAEAGNGDRARSDELDLAELVTFMLGTGMRIGEALAVRRHVIDLAAGVLEVNATAVHRKGRGMMLQERTKSEAGWRVIALPDHVVELCRRRMAMSWPDNSHGLLFPTETGGVRNPSNAQRGFRAATDRLGEYGWVTSHTFRKTVATRLDEAGLSAREIADHLGHAKPSMTQDVYMGRGVASAEAANALGVAA